MSMFLWIDLIHVTNLSDFVDTLNYKTAPEI